jgi:hypothetical protein
MASDVAEASTHKVTLEVENPIAIAEIETVQAAARVADLNNKRIGLYWNRKIRSDVALDKIEELFKGRFTGLEFTRFTTKGGDISLSSQEIETLKQLGNEAIIGGTGD